MELKVGINLQDLYPNPVGGTSIAIDESLHSLISEVVAEFDRNEDKYAKRNKRYEVNKEVNTSDIENLARDMDVNPTLDFVLKYESNRRIEALLLKLTATQARRIKLNVILGIPEEEIARREKVSQNAVSKSILSGLRKLEKIVSVKKF